MRTYTWHEYYENFYNWAQSTRIRNLSALTSLGLADEVGEIIIELQENITAANRLLKKAVEAKLAFCADDLMKFLYANDKALAAAAVYYSASILTVEDIETLYGEVDDEVIIKICAKQHLALPEEMRDENEEWESDENDEPLAENMDVPINNQKISGFSAFCLLYWGLQKALTDCLAVRKNITANAMATAPTARRTTVIATADSITATTTPTAVNSATIKATAA